jgi:hypothetical protein
MSSQIIPLKCRINFRESTRTLAAETIRVWAATTGSDGHRRQHSRDVLIALGFCSAALLTG